MKDEFRLEVENDDIRFKIENDFAKKGDIVKLEVSIPFSSLKTTHKIEKCSSCPVGYMDHNCGRRVPLDYDCIPESCKLSRISVSDLLREVADYIDVANMIK